MEAVGLGGRLMIIYDGPSQLPGDGVTPIVAILTGLNKRSSNPKTGDMLQTWILVRDQHPSEALKSGDDYAICGDCIHRPNGGKRTCYVNIMGPASVWRSFQKGGYESVDPDEAGDIVSGRKVRLGAYGDPAAVPASVWRSLIANVKTFTGYTHQWRDCPDISDLCMASCETQQDVQDAQALGYRTFRVMPKGEEPTRRELVCPSSAEMGRRVTCADCGLCAGAMRHKPRVVPGIAITVHGNAAKSYVVGTSQQEAELTCS
jgi:hypothetical protein